MKRGQATLFVVVGIVFVVVIFLAVVFRSQIAEQVADLEIVKSEAVKALEDDMRTHAESCLQKVTTEGVQQILANGGYYQSPRGSISYASYTVPYYLDRENEEVPSLKAIARELGFYIENTITSCLETYSNTLQVGAPSVSVNFGNTVEVSLRQTLSYTQGDTTVRLRKFTATVDAPVAFLYSSAIAFYDEVKNLAASTFFSQASLAFEKNFLISTPEIVNDSSIFILQFNNSLHKEKDLTFSFALRYPKNAGSDDSFVELNSLVAEAEETLVETDLTSEEDETEAIDADEMLLEVVEGGSLSASDEAKIEKAFVDPLAGINDDAFYADEVNANEEA